MVGCVVACVVGCVVGSVAVCMKLLLLVRLARLRVRLLFAMMVPELSKSPPGEFNPAEFNPESNPEFSPESNPAESNIKSSLANITPLLARELVEVVNLFLLARER